MINTGGNITKLAKSYYSELNKSLIEEDKLGILYSRRDCYGSILDVVTPKPLDTVIDIGCGESTLILLLAKYAKKVYGIDNMTFANYKDWFNDIKDKKEFKSGKIQLFEQSAKNIPLETESIDVVYTVSALEHFENDEDIMCAKEVGRILKVGGYFIGTVDYNPVSEKPFGALNPVKA